MVEQTVIKGLWDPVTDLGIEHTNFFNGRLLTASDLEKEQEANLLQFHQYGQAIGSGVVCGLEVGLAYDGSAGGPPVLSVAAGQAVNRRGHVICLPIPVRVQLARAEGEQPSGGLFTACVPKNGKVLPGKGAYVLAIRPASGFSGSAPKRSFGTGKVEGCGSSMQIQGAQFRLEPLVVDDLKDLSADTRAALNKLMADIDGLKAKTDAASVAKRDAGVSKLRNWLAHVCLGTEEVAGFVRDPFARKDGELPYLAYGAVDALRAAGTLTDCDVPLALVYWTTYKVHFVDMGSVRRRIKKRNADEYWPLISSDRRLSEAEAAYLQFEEQIRDLRLIGTDLALIDAEQYLRYLPAAGLLPLKGPGSASGIDPQVFFGAHAPDAIPLTDGDRIRNLIHTSFYHEPIDLSAAGQIPLYLVYENRVAVEQGTSTQLALLFASPSLPDVGVARFGSAWWGLSHFAHSVT